MSLSAIDRKIAALTAEMQRAAEADDFERAAALRNEIAALQGGGLIRKPKPGEMGLGTNIPVAKPPAGWKPPKKPDPMTQNHKPRRGR